MYLIQAPNSIESTRGGVHMVVIATRRTSWTVQNALVRNVCRTGLPVFSNREVARYDQLANSTSLG